MWLHTQNKKLQNYDKNIFQWPLKDVFIYIETVRYFEGRILCKIETEPRRKLAYISLAKVPPGLSIQDMHFLLL
jgi:hypothetical protein